jgi:hypothetical protein
MKRRKIILDEVTINFEQLVFEMKDNKEHFKQLCKDETDILKKCILCKRYLNSQVSSPILETYIKNKFKINRAIDSTSGDGLSLNKKNIEIKVSLGSNDGQMNFVQIRPHHKIDYYLFLCYNMHEETIGKIYWFLIPSDDLYELLPEYGGYAHNSVEENGKITLEKIYDKNQYEYCLRPNPVKKDTQKCKKLWNIFINKYNFTEEEIIKKI